MKKFKVKLEKLSMYGSDPVQRTLLLHPAGGITYEQNKIKVLKEEKV